MNAVASFFNVTPGKYGKISLSAADASMATGLIWGVCLVIILASLYAFYVQKVPGRVVKALLRAEAKDEESAKTANELGIAPRSLAMLELKNSRALRRIVQQTSEDEPRYFIPDALRYRAQVRYDKEGNELRGLILAMILSIALSILLVNLMPVLLGLIGGTMK